MGFFDFGDDDSEDSSSDDSGGGIVDDISDGVDDVVDDVSDTVDDAVDAGEEAAGDISEGAGDVVDEVSEGDLGGAVDEAADTVEDVASGSSDTGSSGSSGGSSSGGSDIDFDSGGGSDIDFDSGGGSDPDPDPDPDPSNADPVDTGGSSGSGGPNLTDQLLNDPSQEEGLPETQEGVEQAQEFRDQNFILSAASPEVGDALNTREENLEVRNQIDQQIDQIQDAPGNSSIRFGRGEDAETLSRGEALDRLENRRSNVEQTLDQNERNLQRSQSQNQISSSNSNQQQNNQGVIDQGIDAVEGFFEAGAEVVQTGSDLVEEGVNTASEVAGIETPDAPETPEVGIPGADLEVDVDNIWMGNRDNSGDPVLGSTADGQGDIKREFNQFSRDVRDTGLQVMSEGQELGDQFAEVAPNTNEILLKGAGDLTGVDELNQAGEVVGDVTDAAQSGVGTAGTQAAGFFTAGAGSFGMLGVDATEDPVDTGQRFAAGTAGFLSMTAGQFTENPAEFVAEEGGEEVSEAAIGALVAGPAGAAFGATPTVTPEPEVEPEFNPEVEPETEPETTTEVEPEEEPEFGPDEVTMEQLPSGFTQVQEVETNVEPVETDLVEEPAPGVEVRRTGEGQTVYPDQPRAEEFDFQVGEETAGARATPTEPDRINDPGEFRGEDPRTGFTDAEQEIVREVRQRDDVTIRQGDTIDETPPGQNEPDPDQTVIEAEETETGGELLFSVMGPVPPSLVEPETETEINPQPDIQGPDPELADVSPDVDVGSVGPEVEFEPETETEVRVEPETEVEPEVDQSVEPEFDPVIDQREETGQEFDQAQTQEFREEQAPEVTEDRPPEPGPDKIMDFAPDREPEVLPDLRPEPEFKPEPDRTPDRDFGSEDSPFSREAPVDDQVGEAEPEFRPSLEAVLFDVEGEAPGDDEVLTGTEVRPIPEDMEDEFDFPF